MFYPENWGSTCKFAYITDSQGLQISVARKSRAVTFYSDMSRM